MGTPNFSRKRGWQLYYGIKVLPVSLPPKTRQPLLHFESGVVIRSSERNLTKLSLYSVLGKDD